MKGAIAKLYPCHTCLEFHHHRADHLRDCGCLCHTIPETPEVVFTDTNVHHYRKCPHCLQEFPLIPA